MKKGEKNVYFQTHELNIIFWQHGLKLTSRFIHSLGRFKMPMKIYAAKPTCVLRNSILVLLYA